MSSPRKKRDNLSVLKVYLSFIHINTTLKKMAHGIHDIKVILMYTIIGSILDGQLDFVAT